MLILLSMALGVWVGQTGQSAAFVGTGPAIVLCWLTAMIFGGASCLGLVESVFLYNCGLGLPLFCSALRVSNTSHAL